MKKRNHPFKEFRIKAGYSTVQELSLFLSGTAHMGKKFKKFSVFLYKLEQEKELSRKKIEVFLRKISAKFDLNKEEAEILKYKILLWKYFPEKRGLLTEQKILIMTKILLS